MAGPHTLPFPSCVTLEEFLYLSELQLLHMRSRDADILATGLLQTWNKMTCINPIADVSVPLLSPLWRLPCRQFPYMPTASSVSLPEGILWQWWFAWAFLEQIGSQHLQERPSVRERNQQVIISQHPRFQGKNPGVCPTQFLKKSQLDWVSTALSGNLLINTDFIVFVFFFSFPCLTFLLPYWWNHFQIMHSQDWGLRVCFWGNPNKDEHQTQCLALKGTHHQHPTGFLLRTTAQKLFEWLFFNPPNGSA